MLLRGIIESYPSFQPPQVEIQIEGPLPRLLGNEAALTQCFSNLLGNAIKFVAPGTRPTVRVWAERVENPKGEARNPKEGRSPKAGKCDELLPLGTDPSPVTNDQSLDTQHATRNTQHAPASPSPTPSIRLWFADNGVGIPKDAQERIFKMFQRLDKSYDGTGVGLTVVRKAVEKMGGRVGLESEPGRGSRFWMELRAADQPR